MHQERNLQFYKYNVKTKNRKETTIQGTTHEQSKEKKMTGISSLNPIHAVGSPFILQALSVCTITSHLGCTITIEVKYTRVPFRISDSIFWKRCKAIFQPSSSMYQLKNLPNLENQNSFEKLMKRCLRIILISNGITLG